MCEFGVLDVFDCTPTEPHGLTTLLYRRQPPSGVTPFGSLRFASLRHPRGGSFKGVALFQFTETFLHSLLAFADADGAVSADEIVRAEHAFRHDVSDVGFLLGSRVKMLGRTVTRSFKRHLSGRIFATLVSELCGIPVYETQCGLKIIKRRAWEAIADRPKTEGFAFDVELLLLVIKVGEKVVEFPVDWQDIPGSKVSLFRDSWRMALEVVAIRNRIGPLSN